ncbi:3' exoribonuclease family, domain 1-domain-containing protein [Phyllosticta capitalensis]
MPLDTSAYSLALLRLDGRRWNELRRLHAQISTQAAADGSAYLEMGNTKVVCVVTGPTEGRRAATGAAGGGGGDGDRANIEVEIGFAGFSGVERKRRTRGDKRTAEMQHTLHSAFASTLHTTRYPHSTITISLHILSQDGSLLAACINAATLALIDAGVPMSDYLVACTAGIVSNDAANANAGADADPLLDLNSLEESDVPFLTLACLGETERVAVCVMETKAPLARLEPMLAVGVDGCKRVRGLLDEVVRAHGRRMVEGSLG